MFPFVAQVAVGMRDKLAVFGGDFETKDGTGCRDYVHVMDLGEEGIVETLSICSPTLSKQSSNYPRHSPGSCGRSGAYPLLWPDGG